MKLKFIKKIVLPWMPPMSNTSQFAKHNICWARGIKGKGWYSYRNRWYYKRAIFESRRRFMNQEEEAHE